MQLTPEEGGGQVPELERKLRDFETVYDIFSEEKKSAGVDEVDTYRGLDRVGKRFVGCDGCRQQEAGDQNVDQHTSL